jgi:hypothetical protein
MSYWILGIGQIDNHHLGVLSNTNEFVRFHRQVVERYRRWLNADALELQIESDKII